MSRGLAAGAEGDREPWKGELISNGLAAEVSLIRRKISCSLNYVSKG